MAAILNVLILLSVGLILLFFLISTQKYADEESRVRFTTLLFSLWIISTAVWGRYFFEQRLVGFFDITITRLIFVLIFMVMVIGVFTGRVRLRQNVQIEFFMLLFLFLCVASMMRSGFTPVRAGFPSPFVVFLWGYLFPFAAFLFAKNYLSQENELNVIFHLMFFFGVYLSITAFCEFLDVRELIFPRYINDPKVGIHYARARGPLVNAAFNGVGIIIGFVCGVHLLQKKTGFTKLMYVLLLSLFFPAVFFTQTRSIYLSFLVTLVLLLFFYRTTFPKIKTFALPLFFIFLFAAYNAPRLTSEDRREGGVMQIGEVTARIGLAQRSVIMVLDNPFLGVGLGQFIPASVEKYLGRVPMFLITSPEQAGIQHNHLLGIIVEMGLVGLFTYLFIVANIIRRCWQLMKRIPVSGFAGSNMVLIIIIIWIAYLNNNLFVEPSHCLFVNVVPFMFAGIADGLHRKFFLEADAQTAS